jgi:hypothetical protein
MSTVPGQESFDDAGLVEAPPVVPPQIAAEDDEPEGSRPDLRGAAGDSDLAEQEADVADDESEGYPEA